MNAVLMFSSRPSLFSRIQSAWQERPVQDRVRMINAAFVVALSLAWILTSQSSQAFTAPAAGSLGYDVYNLVVNSLLGGPIGFVGAIMVIVWGAFQVMKNWIITIATLICGTVVLKAQSIVTSLGFVAVAHMASAHSTALFHVLGLH